MSIEEAPSTGPSKSGEHRRQDARDCWRLYAIKHRDNREPPRMEPPLAKGSMLHLALAHHYGKMARKPWAADPVEVMREAPANMAYVFEECRAVYAHYRESYPREPFEVLDVEREFSVKLRMTEFGQEIYEPTARLDLVVREAGLAKIEEHKTGSQFRNPREWARNGQIIGQHVLAFQNFPKTYGLDFGGLTINAMRTGDVRGVRRDYITIAANALKSWPKTTYFWLRQEAEMRAKFADKPWDQWPENYGNCTGRWGACELYDACNLGAWHVSDWEKRDIPKVPF